MSPQFWIYVGSVTGAGILLLIAWWKISLAVAAENRVKIEEWERH